MGNNKERVVVLGASQKPDRYAYKAIHMLLEHGHEVIPVHPKLDEVDGLKVVNDLTEISGTIDTVTLYVGADASNKITEAIISLHPKRVIFNPGAENPELALRLSQAGIGYEQACTLVLLRSNQF